MLPVKTAMLAVKTGMLAVIWRGKGQLRRDGCVYGVEDMGRVWVEEQGRSAAVKVCTRGGQDVCKVHIALQK